MRPVFKEYWQYQGRLFPEAIDDYIPEDHVVRLVSMVVDFLDITSIIETYKGDATENYHPRMMLKVLFYAYMNNIFSSREIEKALQENIHFMWLSARQLPDAGTINNFRSRKPVQKLFSALVLKLAEMGALDLRKVPVKDGAKTGTPRYVFVWRGNAHFDKKKLEEKLEKVLQVINAHIKRDSEEENNDALPPKIIPRELLKEKAMEVNRALRKSSSKPPRQ